MWLKLRTSSPSSCGGALFDAVGVVAGGDGFHGVGEGFDRLGDLLGEMQREPAGGEERERGQHEQKQHVEIADAAAVAIEVPVIVDCSAQASDGGGHADGHGQADDDGAALLHGWRCRARSRHRRRRRWAGRCAAAAARMAASVGPSTTGHLPGLWAEVSGLCLSVAVFVTVTLFG